jgi:hypothetical protein
MSLPYFVQVMMHSEIDFAASVTGLLPNLVLWLSEIVGRGSVVNHVDELGSSLLASCMRFAQSQNYSVRQGF